MFLFDHAGRGAPPEGLRSPEVIEALRLIAHQLILPRAERDQTDVPLVWKQTLPGDVLAALGRLSKGRCAFCEDERSDLSVYRFRPPAYAEPIKEAEGKESYLWLSFSWQNLFPICQTCRPWRPNDFPVRGKRAACPAALREHFDGQIDSTLRPETIEALIGASSPSRALEAGSFYHPGEASPVQTKFAVSRFGYLIGKNERAKATIEHFNLNDRETVAGRRGAMTEILRDMAEARGIPSLLSFDRAFGGTIYLVLRQLGEHLAGRFGRRSALSRARIWETFQAWSQEGIFDDGRNDPERLWDEVAPRDDDLTLGQISIASSLPGLRSEASGGVVRPRLTSLQISNFKSLENVSLTLPVEPARSVEERDVSDYESEIARAPCLLLLGENATGKSSVLEAIALGCSSNESCRALEPEPAGLLLQPLYMGVRPSSDRDAIARPTRSTIALTFTHGDGRNENPHLVERTLKIDDRGFHGPDLPTGDDTLPPIFAYGAHRRYGKDTTTGEVGPLATLFDSGLQLPNPEAWLKALRRNDPRGLNEVVAALRHVIQIDGAFESIDLDRAGADEALVINLKKSRGHGDTTQDLVVPQRLDIASSGYRALLAMVCDILRRLTDLAEGNVYRARRMRALVLIDEIEAHLHPRWKLGVIAGLRRALPQTTFVITSHDPLCVRGMFEGEVVVVNRFQTDMGSEGELPEKVELIERLEGIEQMTVEQLLTSDLFRLFSPDDERLERDFARVADGLSRKLRTKDELLKPDEERALERINREIVQALPYGPSEVTRLVQEAVVDYLAERRKEDARTAKTARNRAKDAVKTALRDLLP